MFLSFSILPPCSNFIFIATISICQLINSINTGVFKTWNIQGNAEWRTNEKPFLQMILPTFYSNTFLSLKTHNLKSVFLSKLLSQSGIKLDHLSKNVKNVSFQSIEQNHQFHYCISQKVNNLWLIIPWWDLFLQKYQ